jgi:hypothetical protein
MEKKSKNKKGFILKIPKTFLLYLVAKFGIRFINPNNPLYPASVSNKAFLF